MASPGDNDAKYSVDHEEGYEQGIFGEEDDEDYEDEDEDEEEEDYEDEDGAYALPEEYLEAGSEARLGIDTGPGPPEGQWACAACTLFNNQAATSCIVCMTPRPKVKVCTKLKQRPLEPFNMPTLSSLLSSLKLEQYEKVFADNDLSLTSLLKMISTEEKWGPRIAEFGVKRGHAAKILRELRKYEPQWKKDAAEQKEFILGRRAIVRTVGTKSQPCWYEGRLVEVKNLDKSPGKRLWELTIHYPLCVPHPKIGKFRLEDEGKEFMFVAEPMELKMAKGARVISCFEDKQVASSWAWYEGDVLEWDGTKATVLYTDGCKWNHDYPPCDIDMLDIEQSETVLSTASVRELCKTTHTLPLLVIKSPLGPEEKGGNQEEKGENQQVEKKNEKSKKVD